MVIRLRSYSIAYSSLASITRSFGGVGGGLVSRLKSYAAGFYSAGRFLAQQVFIYAAGLFAAERGRYAWI
jgi:hypothetical protein